VKHIQKAHKKDLQAKKTLEKADLNNTRKNKQQKLQAVEGYGRRRHDSS
jgi:hypothetical protein